MSRQLVSPDFLRKNAPRKTGGLFGSFPVWSMIKVGEAGTVRRRATPEHRSERRCGTTGQGESAS
jgi:hypothetical protein